MKYAGWLKPVSGGGGGVELEDELAGVVGVVLGVLGVVVGVLGGVVDGPLDPLDDPGPAGPSRLTSSAK
jgi:hypothetical protein